MPRLVGLLPTAISERTLAAPLPLPNRNQTPVRQQNGTASFFSWGCATSISNIEEEKEREFGEFGASETDSYHLYLSVQSWILGHQVMVKKG